MLHAVRIKAGKASYSNAYVQTSLMKQEKKAGKPLKLQACPLFTLSHLSHALYMTGPSRRSLGTCTVTCGSQAGPPLQEDFHGE